MRQAVGEGAKKKSCLPCVLWEYRSKVWPFGPRSPRGFLFLWNSLVLGHGVVFIFSWSTSELTNYASPFLLLLLLLFDIPKTSIQPLTKKLQVDYCMKNRFGPMNWSQIIPSLQSNNSNHFCGAFIYLFILIYLKQCFWVTSASFHSIPHH